MLLLYLLSLNVLYPNFSSLAFHASRKNAVPQLKYYSVPSTAKCLPPNVFSWCHNIIIVLPLHYTGFLHSFPPIMVCVM